MRNVSGYLTEDNMFFQDKKEAEAHERFINIHKRINDFVDIHYKGDTKLVDALLHWERYRQENNK